MQITADRITFPPFLRINREVSAVLARRTTLTLFNSILLAGGISPADTRLFGQSSVIDTRSRPPGYAVAGDGSSFLMTYDTVRGIPDAPLM